MLFHSQPQAFRPPATSFLPQAPEFDPFSRLLAAPPPHLQPLSQILFILLVLVLLLVRGVARRVLLREGYGSPGRVEVQEVEQPHPLAELAVAGLGRTPKLQVEGAARLKLDLELTVPFVVDEELDELQGEQTVREGGACSGPDPPRLRSSGALRVGGAPTSSPFSARKESFFTFSAS